MTLGDRPADRPADPVADPTQQFRLDGRVAIVTGASSGLGARFARVLDAAGARLVLAARRSEPIRALADELADAIAVPTDLAADGAPSALVTATMEHFGAVDVLVNNAGTSTIRKALDVNTDDFRRTMEVNLVAPFELAREAARAMIGSSRGGVIVNLGSLWGVVGIGQMPEAAYAASKGGIINLTRELAAQWARKGVRVNALCPGWFRSEMASAMFDDPVSNEWMVARAPMGRGGEPHELDGALLFLASDASSFMTGAILAVDGGWTAI